MASIVSPSLPNPGQTPTSTSTTPSSSSSTPSSSTPDPLITQSSLSVLSTQSLVSLQSALSVQSLSASALASQASVSRTSVAALATLSSISAQSVLSTRSLAFLSSATAGQSFTMITVTPTTTPTQSSGGGGGGGSSTNIGAIVGGVVGGVVALIALAVLLLVCLRRKKHDDGDVGADFDPDANVRRPAGTLPAVDLDLSHDDPSGTAAQPYDMYSASGHSYGAGSGGPMMTQHNPLDYAAAGVVGGALPGGAAYMYGQHQQQQGQPQQYGYEGGPRSEGSHGGHGQGGMPYDDTHMPDESAYGGAVINPYARTEYSESQPYRGGGGAAAGVAGAVAGARATSPTSGSGGGSTALSKQQEASQYSDSRRAGPSGLGVSNPDEHDDGADEVIQHRDAGPVRQGREVPPSYADIPPEDR